MSTIYASTDLQGAINKAVAGDTVVQTADWHGGLPLTLKSGITLKAGSDARIFERVVGMGVHHVVLQDLEILHSPLSGVWLEGASNIKATRCQVRDYNTTDTNGHGGFVMHGDCSAIAFDECETYLGNGNGFRMTYDNSANVPRFVNLTNCAVWGTKGQSSEGITLGSSVRLRGCRVQSANVWGILAWTDGPLLYDITISDCQILNSSQSSAGSHSAICLNPNGNAISNVWIELVTADDTQTPPTQSRLIMVLDGGKGGTVEKLTIANNKQKNQLSPNPVVIVPTVKLINPNIDMTISTS